jgi:hypothetical protein
MLNIRFNSSGYISYIDYYGKPLVCAIPTVIEVLVIYHPKDFLFERSRDIEAVALVDRIYEVN